MDFFVQKINVLMKLYTLWLCLLVKLISIERCHYLRSTVIQLNWQKHQSEEFVFTIKLLFILTLFWIEGIRWSLLILFYLLKLSRHRRGDWLAVMIAGICIELTEVLILWVIQCLRVFYVLFWSTLLILDINS